MLSPDFKSPDQPDNQTGAAPYDLLAIARAYVANHFSVTPIRVDGSKAPALRSWKEFQERLPTDHELQSWFGNQNVGLAILGGAISGHLTVLDFDHGPAFEQWRPAADELDPAWRDLCPVIRTPSGGAHVYLRCSAQVLPNTKLAFVAGKAIETRGQGGYVLAPGCPSACHQSGRLYEQSSGPNLVEWTTTIEKELFLDLIEAARCLQSDPKPALACDRDEPVPPESQRPGDVFNQRASWEEVLLPAAKRTQRHYCGMNVPHTNPTRKRGTFLAYASG